MKAKNVFLLILVLLVTAFFVIVIPNKDLITDTLRPTDAHSESEEVTFAETGTGGSPYKYYVTHLNAKQKEAYYNILNAIDEMPERIRIPKLTQGELDALFTALTYDNPRLFCIGTGCRVLSIGSLSYCTFPYTMTKEEYTAALAQTDAVAEKIIARLTAPYDKWQCEREIHDYLVNNCEYLFESNNDAVASPYGALVTGTASCEGYARAAKFLFDKAGIESHLISGYATSRDGETQAHMWNAVCINGTWAHLDVTWDDPVGGEYKGYTYFNVTDEEIGLDHSKWTFGHKCISRTQGYYMKKGLYFEEWHGANSTALARSVGAELAYGRRSVTLRFGNKEAFESAKQELITNQHFDVLLKNIGSYASVKLDPLSLQYAEDTLHLTLTLVPKSAQE